VDISHQNQITHLARTCALLLLVLLLHLFPLLLLLLFLLLFSLSHTQIHAGPAGPLLVGNIKVHLKSTPLIACISNAIIFSEDDGKSKAPILSLDLEKGSFVRV